MYDERWVLKSMPEAVKGIPKYVYSRTTGKGLSQSERVSGEEVRGRITPDFGRLTEMPLRTLQVATTDSMRLAMTWEEGRSKMSSAKRRQGDRKGCGSRCAIECARSSMYTLNNHGLKRLPWNRPRERTKVAPTCLLTISCDCSLKRGSQSVE